jgi:hypothetical protein
LPCIIEHDLGRFMFGMPVHELTFRSDAVQHLQQHGPQ